MDAVIELLGIAEYADRLDAAGMLMVCVSAFMFSLYRGWFVTRRYAEELRKSRDEYRNLWQTEMRAK